MDLCFILFLMELQNWSLTKPAFWNQQLLYIQAQDIYLDSKLLCAHVVSKEFRLGHLSRAAGFRFLAGNALAQVLTVLIYILCNQDQESLSFSLHQKLEIFFVIN